ncbi:hypothetical protein WAI453_007538 [Rhynchosporium graminicola]|uniref:Uncharacterized protein n=2 Tax=Rhynchosporium TaxID=38037 RepID=A0A1E1MPI2_RHYSE|nr:uncharacterized protein RCO7_09151 [Rhynchosporium commune]CZT50986.1 uncharacterized protein RSE6_12067 [Rhynchosporium secalis]
MNGFRTRTTGLGHFNANQPFGNNPFINVPADVNRNPFRLFLLDLGYVVHLRKLLIRIILPLGPMISGPLDELYPSKSNLKDLILHTILFITQLILLGSLPIVTILFWLVPGVVPVVFVTVFWIVTWVVMRLLNGAPTTECLVGLPDGLEPVNDEHELWFFINGVATGKNWLQSNLNLLARTFQREIVGIHNTTYGFLFDLLECLIQRDLDYKSRDIRQGRAQIRAALAAPATNKLVLILHSQGGIEGSSILDWLLADMSHEVIGKLEIFTFGNAARHFNNPLVSKPMSPLVDESKGGRGERVIKYIEHYANTEDFVANYGVLSFTSPSAQPFADGNAFCGSVFTREGSGHLLNMHYLDKMFTIVNGKVDEDGNPFMNTLIPSRNVRENATGAGERKMIKDVSRLWQYRNGLKPVDEVLSSPSKPANP